MCIYICVYIYIYIGLEEARDVRALALLKHVLASGVDLHELREVVLPPVHDPHVGRVRLRERVLQPKIALEVLREQHCQGGEAQRGDDERPVGHVDPEDRVQAREDLRTIIITIIDYR